MKNETTSLIDRSQIRTNRASNGGGGLQAAAVCVAARLDYRGLRPPGTPVFRKRRPGPGGLLFARDLRCARTQCLHRFGLRMFPNLYCILVSPTAMRKSTTINLAAYVAKRLGRTGRSSRRTASIWRPGMRLIALRQTGGSTELSFQLLQRRLHPERPISTPSIAKRTAFARSATGTTSPTWHGSKPSWRNFAVLRL